VAPITTKALVEQELQFESLDLEVKVLDLLEEMAGYPHPWFCLSLGMHHIGQRLLFPNLPLKSSLPFARDGRGIGSQRMVFSKEHQHFHGIYQNGAGCQNHRCPGVQATWRVGLQDFLTLVAFKGTMVSADQKLPSTQVVIVGLYCHNNC